jgi:DUF1680 family protein
MSKSPSSAVTPAIDDVLHAPAPGTVNLRGHFAHKIEIGIQNHLKKLSYPRLVDYFRNRPNPFAAGEFWGKTVRSACLSYQYHADPELKKILDETVADLLSTQTPDGCISARTYDEQPKSSDLWERKYVLLGLLHYYEIDPRADVLEAMIREADYTIAQIGPAPKTRIIHTGWAFDGIESSTILEPMMKLYNLTGDTRYLDFARYIVEEEGGCKRGSIFEAAFRGVAPKDIGGNGKPEESIAKAYESMSCFEGLIEYFRVTGNAHWKEAALTYYKNIREQEMTVIGSGGADKPYNLGPGHGEQWNGTAAEQTNPDINRMAETCVTVTWMKFCYQLLRLTGDSTIADQIEIALYNALDGAQKPTGDNYDYYQRLNGRRGAGDIGFSYDVDGFPLSCCTANGPMGMALIPFFAVMESQGGPVVNLFAPASARIKTPGGKNLTLEISTDYPKSNAVSIGVTVANLETFTISVRIPEWSGATTLVINNEPHAVTPGSYAKITREWKTGDRVDLRLDLHGRVVQAPKGINPASHHFQAILYGPLALARDKRLGGDIRQPVRIKSDGGGNVALAPFETKIGQVGFTVPTADGSSFAVIDYASAGNSFADDSEYMTWIPHPA